MPIAVAEDTVLHIKMQETDIPGEFVAKGKVQLEPGWKLIEGIDGRKKQFCHQFKKEIFYR